MRAVLPIVAGLVLFAGLALPAIAAEAWRATLQKAAEQRDGISQDLGRVFSELLERSRRERPDLVRRLQPPLGPSPIGYGRLPPVDPDMPEIVGPGEPYERSYFIPDVVSWENNEKTYIANLEKKVLANGGDLGAMVDDYFLRKENFRRIDQHVRYHEAWQPEARRTPEYYKRLNGLMADYRVWRSTAEPEARRAEAERRLREGLLTEFSPAPGLRMEKIGGEFILRVPMVTDAEDDGFLAKFSSGVARTWNEAPAMRQARLRIELALSRRSPKSLYPEGPPSIGAPIDMDKHLERFGPAALILTTGASATQARPARAILLSPFSATPRSLAHEFGHILGFHDNYLRAYTGSLDDPNGVMWWEITPFPSDLMANPGAGRVTEDLVRKLFEAYGPR